MTQGWVLSITTSNLACVDGSANAANLGVAAQPSTNPVFTSSNFDFDHHRDQSRARPGGRLNLTDTLPAGFVLESVLVGQGVWSKPQWHAGLVHR